MRILIDIGHPGHVHLFRPFAQKMQKKGHNILFTCRQKEFEIELLEAAKFKYISFGKHYNSLRGKLWGLVKFDLKMLFTAIKFKPEVLLSHGSIYASHAAFMIGKPHIALEDSENMEQIRLYKPFSKIILTPEAIPQKYGKKQIRHNGFHQSAYLHPAYFKRNINFKVELGIPDKEKVFLLRLVALTATHDTSLSSIGNDQLFSLIDFLKEKGRIFISSEKPLLKELEQYKLSIEPHKIHDFISICDLIIGESGAMTSEAAYLGVPNILIANLDLNVHRKYSELGLKIHYKELNEEKINDIKSIVNNLEVVKKNCKEKSDHYIENSIDLTEYLVELTELTVKKSK